MLQGIGVDVLDLKRLKPLEGKWDDPFFTHTFSEAERAEALASPNPLSHFASRFAVKEAVVKALNGNAPSVDLRTIETLSGADGEPIVTLTGGLPAELLSRLRVHVSISHEESFCVAFVVCETSLA